MADDSRDVRVEAAALRSRQVIARELAQLEGQRRGGALNHKRALIVELIQLGRREVHGDKQELREDRHETREDRRETREDRRH